MSDESSWQKQAVNTYAAGRGGRASASLLESNPLTRYLNARLGKLIILNRMFGEAMGFDWIGEVMTKIEEVSVSLDGMRVNQYIEAIKAENSSPKMESQKTNNIFGGQG